jgi:predicted GTPase
MLAPRLLARSRGCGCGWRLLSTRSPPPPTVGPEGLPLGEGRMVVQIFGANTDVGKTVVAAGLCRAAVAAGLPPEHVRYIKPLQTGGDDADIVRRLSSPVRGAP